MHHACDLCSADQPIPLPQDPRISVCGSCGFVYVTERRSSAEIAASWEEIYSSGAYDPNWPAVKARLYYVAEWIDQNIGLAGKHLLDIGAGKGQFMREARKRGADVFGIEPATDEGDGWIRKHAVEDGPIAGPPFDIVTINWTLENCGDCLAMLRFARQHCKPDGWVVVATGSRILVPYKKWLSAYLNTKIPADLHCFRWSYNSLNKAFCSAGLHPSGANLYEECDWMVLAATRTDKVIDAAGDNPHEVLAFFHSWAKLEAPTHPTTWTYVGKPAA